MINRNSTIHFKSVISIIVTVCSSQWAAAAPEPLIEFRYAVTNAEGGSVPSTSPFRFLVEEELPPQPTLTYVNWLGNYAPSDAGSSFFAPADVVAGANTAFDVSAARYSMRMGMTNYGSPATLSEMPNGTNPSLCSGYACKNQLVSNLAAYQVTAVERVIDQLTITPGGNGYVLRAGQTIRYWGEVVPEPSSTSLLLVYVAAILPLRFRR
jgi:hypothetical protein